MNTSPLPAPEGVRVFAMFDREVDCELCWGVIAPGEPFWWWRDDTSEFPHNTHPAGQCPRPDLEAVDGCAPDPAGEQLELPLAPVLAVIDGGRP